MIDRNDMLELTRRMTLSRHNFDRAAGAYIDAAGDFDGSFNVSFLKLSSKDREKNLDIAKTVPFAKTNDELKRYSAADIFKNNSDALRLIAALCECGLKNDALMDMFYDMVMERLDPGIPYSVLMYHGAYDIPLKSTAGDYQGESEETYSYVICALCDMKGEYEPGDVLGGFLYPAFSGRSSDSAHIDIFTSRDDKGLSMYDVLKNRHK